MDTDAMTTLRKAMLSVFTGLGLASMVASAVAADCTAPPAPGKAAARSPFIESLLGRMTLEEKLGQLNQLGGQGTPTGPQVRSGGDAEIRRGEVGSFLGVHGAAGPLLLLAGAISERRGEFGLSERYYRQVVDEDPTLVHAHKNLGDVAYRKTQHDEAAEHYRRAISIDPDFGDDVYAKLANIHYKKRERDEAIRYWSRALELNPNNQVVRNNLDIVASAAE